MIPVVISGAAGRLGRRILALGLASEAVEVMGALVRAGSSAEGTSCALLSGAQPVSQDDLQTSSDEAQIQASRVVVEVAPWEPAMVHARRAAEVGAPLLMASTGFSNEAQQELEALAKKIPLLLAPNLSMGIAVLVDLVARASKALAAYDLEIVELHHNQKRDAPSGTAWALGRAAANARGQDLDRDAILARAGEIGPRGKQEIGIQTVRGGDIIGEHTVYLAGATERIELVHRAATRDTFAAGAITGAQFLGASDREPGLYSMRDVLGLD